MCDDTLGNQFSPALAKYPSTFLQNTRGYQSFYSPVAPNKNRFFRYPCWQGAASHPEALNLAKNSASQLFYSDLR